MGGGRQWREGAASLGLQTEVSMTHAGDLGVENMTCPTVLKEREGGGLSVG